MSISKEIAVLREQQDMRQFQLATAAAVLKDLSVDQYSSKYEEQGRGGHTMHVAIETRGVQFCPRL